MSTAQRHTSYMSFVTWHWSTILEDMPSNNPAPDPKRCLLGRLSTPWMYSQPSSKKSLRDKDHRRYAMMN